MNTSPPPTTKPLPSNHHQAPPLCLYSRPWPHSLPCDQASSPPPPLSQRRSARVSAGPAGRRERGGVPRPKSSNAPTEMSQQVSLPACQALCQVLHLHSSHKNHFSSDGYDIVCPITASYAPSRHHMPHHGHQCCISPKIAVGV